MPTVAALHGNFPNPFNPATTISFDLPAKTQVALRVFDQRGHLVTTLVDEVRGAGAHAVAWNGLDSQGRRVTFGRLRLPAGGRRLRRHPEDDLDQVVER